MNGLAPKVLVVDNDAGLLMAVTTRLESVGYRCVQAQSGAQAFAELRRDSFDLLITDLNMPLGDGMVLASTFRRVSEAPIVVISGFVVDYAQELGEIKNVTVMPKPFETHQLVDTIVGLVPCTANESYKQAG